MMYLWPASLQLLAFAVVVAEILIPSFGVLALIALALGAYSWYFILTQLPQGAALAFGIADLILLPIAVRFGFAYLGRSPVSHRTHVGAGSGLEETARELARQVGRTAVAETALRPAGKVRLDGELYEARTAGDFVERGADVRISGLRGHEFLVEKT